MVYRDELNTRVDAAPAPTLFKDQGNIFSVKTPALNADAEYEQVNKPTDGGEGQALLRPWDEFNPSRGDTKNPLE